MSLSNILFIANLPSLDIHGIDRDYARIKINEFIEDSHIMGNEYIVIVHGMGTGVLTKETSKTLRENKKVVEYQIYRGNNGCTIAKIIKKKKWKKLDIQYF